jgi:hypothetical protein
MVFCAAAKFGVRQPSYHVNNRERQSARESERSDAGRERPIERDQDGCVAIGRGWEGGRVGEREWEGGRDEGRDEAGGEREQRRNEPSKVPFEGSKGLRRKSLLQRTHHINSNLVTRAHF